jgi:hypothetical protein
MEERPLRAYARLIMSANTDSGSSAASDSSAAEDAAAVPLDLLLGDAATGMLRRLNLGGSGLRLAVPAVDQRAHRRDVNPPGNAKARYQLAEECPDDPKEFLQRAQSRQGSWWSDYARWLAGRCREEIAAPTELGGSGLPPICEAPGTYVYDR